MGRLDVYSAINAGAAGRYNATDAHNGGAPGTVRDKVETQMADHEAKAAALLGGTFTPQSASGASDIRSSDYAPTRPITVPQQMAADAAQEAAGAPGIGTTIVNAAREDSLTG